VVELSKTVEHVLGVLVKEPLRSTVERRLVNDVANNLPFHGQSQPEDLDRVRLSIVRVVANQPERLDECVEMAKTKWMELFQLGGFGDFAHQHEVWYKDFCRELKGRGRDLEDTFSGAGLGGARKLTKVALILGAIPLIPYPAIFIANMKSLAAERSGNEPEGNLGVEELFLYSSTAYPLVWIFSWLAARSWKYDERRRLNVAVSLLPILYLGGVLWIFVQWFQLVNAV